MDRRYRVFIMASIQAIADQPLETVLALARTIGWGAADILRAYYRGEPPKNLATSDQDSPVTAADLAVSHYIQEKLEAELGTTDFGYLNEETHKTQRHTGPLTQPWVWIIDPLDGTRDFLDKTGEYAVHLALTHGDRPVLAVVAWPEREKLYYATQGGGTFQEDRDGTIQRIQVSSRDQLTDLGIVVSRTHRDARFNRLLDQLPTKALHYVGSVGCKIATILEQQADIYISLSGKSAPKDWDMAAPELLLTEAGGQFTTVEGKPLRYNQGDVHQWGCLVASNGRCHSELCAILGQGLEAFDA